MRFFTTLCVLAAAALASARSPQHVGKKLPELRQRVPAVARALYKPEVEKRAVSLFATAKTKSTQSNFDATKFETDPLQNLLSMAQLSQW
jgi:hypothetical protein